MRDIFFDKLSGNIAKQVESKARIQTDGVEGLP